MQPATRSSMATLYDAENHLLAAGGVTYTYDGDGKRVQKSNGKIYWYGMGSDVLNETDPLGNTNNASFNEYVFFGGKRIARRNSSNTVFYYFADHLGTSRVIVQAGQTTPCYDADFYPYGGERALVINTCPQNYKFIGKERDIESGLDDFIARYYGSAVGRFITPDWSESPEPVPWADFENSQSLNLYTYARNNPLSQYDDGHSCVKADNGFLDDGDGKGCAEAGVLPNDNPTLPNGDANPDQFVSKPVRVKASGDVPIPGDPEANRRAAAMIGVGGERFIAAFAKEAIIAGVTGGAAGEILNGVREGLGLTEAAITSLNIGRVVVGQTIDVIFQTAAGPVRIYAEVIAVEGSTVTLSVAVYATESGTAISVGVREMLAGARPILARLAAAGVKEVIITAKRLGGANPGRDMFLRLTLK